MLCFISVFTLTLLIPSSLGISPVQGEQASEDDPLDSLDARKDLNFGPALHEFNAHDDMYVSAMDFGGFRLKRRHSQNDGYYCGKSPNHLEFTTQTSVKIAAKKACKELERLEEEEGDEDDEEDEDEVEEEEENEGKRRPDHPNPKNAFKYVKYPPPYYESQIHKNVNKDKSVPSVIIDIDCHIVDVVARDEDKRYHQCVRV
ncbi:hypothetical protein GcM3_114015 [Golovinomyces cichoracearum]|uniref:Secreted effector protein n=1 Tax=Golovinomyces cichoracearum TaxID=62708 RepID=A0A420I8C5_9PEZI|nr:hypothetical protein GcM3_114015 [Golovinomyces cichoracearum]